MAIETPNTQNDRVNPSRPGMRIAGMPANGGDEPRPADLRPLRHLAHLFGGGLAATLEGRDQLWVGIERRSRQGRRTFGLLGVVA